ncbi:MAG: gliding motility-associated C-terminal domain-containing protein [Bacteroidales bacterium]|jgi:gliding motility-associated-like protein|nr:gliding motility-associated C-terminal domain-containing protein [Bacteroidales bacterium]
MKTYQNIGELYRENFTDYAPQPPKRVWKNIASAVGVTKFPLWGKIVIPVAGAVLMSAILLWMLPQKGVQQTVNEQNTIIVEQSTEPENNVVSDVPPQTAPAQSNVVTSTDNNIAPQAPNLPTHAVAPALTSDVPTTVRSNSGHILPNITENVSKQTDNKQNTNTIVEKSALAEPVYTTKTEVAKSSKKLYQISKDTTVCQGSSLVLYALNCKNPRWSNLQEQAKITVNVDYTTQYWVAFTLDNGQDTTVYINVTAETCAEVFIPNSFTPNGDGLNDVFTVSTVDNLSSYMLTIYNLSGRIIFISKDINHGWDGMYEGIAQPYGRYIYQLQYTDSRGQYHNKKGDVLLLR